MHIAVVTGSSGLVGSEVCRVLAGDFDQLVGIDNDMRKQFFGEEASTSWNGKRLIGELGNKFNPHSIDIRDLPALERAFADYSSDIAIVVHCAAQPSHDWAARDPHTDFSVNATGTLNMLELTRKYCPQATFIHMSTNKVYGDTPNALPLVELETRWEVAESHPFFKRGIDESMSIDHSTHSLFGVSKTAGDLLAQEYGRYFGLKTGIFRGGCLTGPSHSGTELHGFLSYLMLCAITGKHYTVYGYKGKQVRDSIHSRDLVEAFRNFHRAPRPGEVYNMGGSRHSHCSMLEAIALCEKITGKKMNTTMVDTNRIGDHIWYVSDVAKFQAHYPQWKYRYNLEQILVEIHDGLAARLAK
jgi:CDP-paratose 2-epimerase